MLSRHDDYPIHQTPEPLAHPATGDRNFYDRYWFNGFSRDGELFFAVALGVYPNRSVMDAAFSVVRGGHQYALHASRLAPRERTESRVGPVAIEVLEPLRRLRVSIAPNDTGLEGELVFRARTSATEEPRTTRRQQGRIFMDSTRLTQFGTWTGTIGVEGTPIEVTADRVLGVRDRSWGVRPVGEREAGAPGTAPQFFWLWAPVHFDDICTHFGTNEDENGVSWHANGAIIPTYPSCDEIPACEEPRIERMPSVAHRIRWRKGTRRSQGAEIELIPSKGDRHVISLEPVLSFQMLGLGYLHPEWGHGMWKGEEALAGESWTLDALDPLDPRHIHVQQLCRARMGEREGMGVLEQLVIGPHHPSGFTSLFDGAA
jgi:hypothetical protein